MQCYESEVTRNSLFALCCELDPCLQRDELLLEVVLAAHGVAALFELGEEALQALVREVVQELPVAA